MILLKPAKHGYNVYEADNIFDEHVAIGYIILRSGKMFGYAKNGLVFQVRFCLSENPIERNRFHDEDYLKGLLKACCEQLYLSVHGKPKDPDTLKDDRYLVVGVVEDLTDIRSLW